MIKQSKYFICMILMGAVFTAHAATRTWLSSGSGEWGNTDNWQDGQLPGADDIADLSAATATIELTAEVSVGELLFNPTPVNGTTNVLVILSDTAAPSSRTITLTSATLNHLQVGEGAELRLDADVLSNGNLLKDGYGTLVVGRRLYAATVAASQYLFWIEQGRVVNEGTISAPSLRMMLGTVEPEAGAAPELVLRAGSAYLSTSTAFHNDVFWGANRLFAAGKGSRAVVRHEGGVLNLTTNLTSGAFLNAYAAGGHSVYTLSGGEVDFRNKVVYVGYNGTGVVNQTGGRFRASALNFSSSATGSGTYNLSGGELWLGGIAQPGSGRAAFNIGGARLYPSNKGFSIWSSTNPRFTGVGGPTRFCSEGSGFTNSIAAVQGPGGFVKEGADTLDITGWASFSGPIIVSNGTVNVRTIMNGNNAVLVAGGNLNLDAGAATRFSSLMVTAGVFRVASNALLTLSGTDPWVQVQGTGIARLLDGSKLPRLDVSGTGAIDLTQGGTATVYRVRINGSELPDGFYSAAECAVITGSGVLHVRFQREPHVVIDTFSRTDGPVAYDSLGQSEEPDGSYWSEFSGFGAIENVASITNGELRLGVGTADPALALTDASWPNGVFSTRMRFNRVGAAGTTLKNACGLLLRRNITLRTGINNPTVPDWRGAVHVLMTASGGLFLRENYDQTKYGKNPFTGSASYLNYGAPGSLPTSINGLPFDANGDGRLDGDEPFDLRAILSGNRLQVLINGEPIMAYNGFTSASASEENCAGLWKNRMSSANFETHDSYHDDFSATNLPYVIRHIGKYDPNVAATQPRENWGFGGNATLVSVGPVTETIGGESVDAWKINDASSVDGSFAHYVTLLSAAEIAVVNTNYWRFTIRLRVVNSNDAMDDGVGAQVATKTRAFSLQFGSDASGNAQVRVNNGSTYLVAGGSVYHTYVMEYNPTTAKVNLFCDGALLERDVLSKTFSLDRILFGANGSAVQGNAHYALVQFEILPPPIPPPPGTVLILR